MILLDTHVLLWFRFGDDRLGAEPRRTIEHAWGAGEVAVSAVSFWEISLLHSKRRLALLQEIGAWRRRLLREGLKEIPVDGEIGIRAAELVGFHADPADRLIVSTALDGHRLATADRLILDWPGPVSRLRADTESKGTR